MNLSILSGTDANTAPGHGLGAGMWLRLQRVIGVPMQMASMFRQNLDMSLGINSLLRPDDVEVQPLSWRRTRTRQLKTVGEANRLLPDEYWPSYIIWQRLRPSCRQRYSVKDSGIGRCSIQLRTGEMPGWTSKQDVIYCFGRGAIRQAVE